MNRTYNRVLELSISEDLGPVPFDWCHMEIEMELLEMVVRLGQMIGRGWKKDAQTKRKLGTAALQWLAAYVQSPGFYETYIRTRIANQGVECC